MGRVLGQSPEAQRSRRETQRSHYDARRDWERSGQASISEGVYKTEIQPKLKNVTLSAIMNALHVSVVYASHIPKGRRVPHPRHWHLLEQLALTAARGVTTAKC